MGPKESWLAETSLWLDNNEEKRTKVSEQNWLLTSCDFIQGICAVVFGPWLLFLGKRSLVFTKTLILLHIEIYAYGQPAPGAESHFEFCCSFPQNAHTLHALESSIFVGFLSCLLRSSDLDLVNPSYPARGAFFPPQHGGVNLTHPFLTASEGSTRHILCNII